MYVFPSRPITSEDVTGRNLLLIIVKPPVVESTFCPQSRGFTLSFHREGVHSEKSITINNKVVQYKAKKLHS
jgi:hypothetical protein